MRNSAIAASGLRKAYKDKVVLDGIDLDVETGTVFSLLGPNGAGKTTTVNVLTTLIKADGGTALVAGHDVAAETKAVRAAIGVTGQFAAVDELLTGQENLQLMADLKHQVPGSHVRLRFTGVAELDKAAGVLAGSTRDDENLTLRVPSDGRAKSLRALLNELDEQSIDVEEFSAHTPDLDDVFLALTGHASTEENAQ